MTVADRQFPAMGSTLRIVVEDREADRAAVAGRAFLEDVDRRLSRFRPDSELCALNADPRAVVPASALLRAAVGAATWAAATTGGLVDPTLLPELEAAGYTGTRATATPAPLREALAGAPPRHPARARVDGRWRDVTVDDERGVVERRPGLRLDTGGTTKGLAADAAVHRLAHADRVAVDCAGDVRVGGRHVGDHPFELEVEHPLTGEVAHRLLLAGGACATSGLDRNCWRRPDGSFGHHLLDPATGEPAWTGLVGATALAPTALEAETLAKWALLTGPEGARRVLAAHGGLAFHEDGSVEPLGLLARSAAVA